MQINSYKNLKITERILLVLDYYNISQYKLNKDLGFSKGFLDKKREISTDKYAKILGYFPEINPLWLLNGSGVMLKEKKIEGSNIVQGVGNVGNNQSINYAQKKTASAVPSCCSDCPLVANLNYTIKVQKDLIELLKKSKKTP